METRTAFKRKEIRQFLQKEIQPFVEEADEKEQLPEQLIVAMAGQGFLGATLPQKYGGLAMTQVEYAMLTEELGKVCSSCRSLLTVHLSLVAETILRWGTVEQKVNWLPALANGQKIAAFCLTEKSAGSNPKGIQATYQKNGDHYQLNGTKKWTTFGQRADVYLVLARNEEQYSAFLVNRNTPGLRVKPIKNMLGTRASMIGEISFEDCVLGPEHLLGREGMGFFQMVQTALDNGRFSVALGSLGIAKACLEDSVEYVKKRKQFGQLLKDHQLIKRKIANMITEVKAATLLCYHAAELRDQHDPESVIQTSIAKYHAAQTAFKAANEAVQIHGALGCHNRLPIQRYFRDAKIMEIIEGTNEIQQILIADYGMNALQTLINSTNSQY